MTVTHVEVATAVADDPPEPAEPAAHQPEWRWIPEPGEADEPRAHSRLGSGSTWNDNLIRAMAWAKLHGAW